MDDNGLLLLKGAEVHRLLQGQEAAMMQAVQGAYQAHARGLTVMPPDGYLRFPGRDRERIISKVAYLGGDFEVAGIKWIASFPGNVARGMERASATIILNATETGRPVAILEGSAISARRTAASAALGAQQLYASEHLTRVGLIGCGLINFEILGFLLAVYPMLEVVHVFDLSEARAAQFCVRAAALKPGLACRVEADLTALLGAAPLVSLATTAVSPHIDALDACPENAVLLHISLRDLTADLVLQADNVVDDVDKACSNRTSLHLAEQRVGHRRFIRTTIGDLLNGDAAPRDPAKPFTLYSPFGLGILDLALARLVYHRARTQGIGTTIDGFLSKSWLERS